MARRMRRVVSFAVVAALGATLSSASWAQNIVFVEDFEALPLQDSDIATDGADETDWNDLGTVQGSGHLTDWTMDPRTTPVGSEDEYFGWTFWDSAAWLDQQGDQDGRENWNNNVGPNGTHALVDPDAHDDFTGFGESPEFTAALRTPAVDLGGLASVTIRFDSSWRPEVPANQTGEFNVYLDGVKQNVFRWESEGQFFKDNATFETVQEQINTAGASTIALEWDMVQAGNDWWWAIDNILASDGPPLTLEVNRDTGEARIINGDQNAVSLSQYSVSSTAGALSPANWQSISGNADSTGDGSVDADDAWNVSSSMVSELAEASDGVGELALEQVYSLGEGAWTQYYTEDLAFRYATASGVAGQGSVVFVGNGGAPFGFADLNFDGTIDVGDWTEFKSDLNADLTGLTGVQLYNASDLNEDGVQDILDVNAFRTAFDAANGEGAFAAMIGVPEPHSVALAAVAILVGVFVGMRPTAKRLSSAARKSAWIGAVAALALVTLSGRATAKRTLLFEDFEGLSLEDSLLATDIIPVTNLAAADALRSGESPVPVNFPVSGQIDFADLLDGEEFGIGRFQEDIVPPGLTAIDHDNYAVFTVGTLDVSSAGVYTFGTHNDDGARLRVDLNQNGSFEASETLINDDALHGAEDRFAAPVNLATGNYDFEWTYFENTGDSQGEAFYSPGEHTSFDTGSFALIGDDFEGIGLNGAMTATTYIAVDEGTDFTQTPPSGWTTDHGTTPTGGPRPFYGFNFLDKQFWINEQGDQDRSMFTRGQNTVAVVDGDAYDDGIDIDPDQLQTMLVTPQIAFSGESPGGLVLEYDNSFRPENDQLGMVDVSYDGGATWENIITYDTESLGGNGSFEKVNARESFQLDNPTDGTVQFRFYMPQSGNNWWWAVDNIELFAVEPLKLLVDSQNGNMALVGGDDSDPISAYQVSSESGSLTGSVGGLEGVDGELPGEIGEGEGEAWELLKSNTDLLLESFLLGNSLLPPNEEVVLNGGFNAAGGIQDLVLSYTNADGQLLTGVVEYCEGCLPPLMGGLTADFDGDGDVDGDDLGIWEGALGVNASADADGDGDSDGNDFKVWQREFTGPLAAEAANAAVPEPAAWQLAIVLTAGLMGRRRRSHRR